MTVAELIERLEDVDPNTEIKLAMQPNYPMQGSIENVCLENDLNDKSKQKCIWIACSENQSYDCPHSAWMMEQIYTK